MAKPLVVNEYSSGWLKKGFSWVYKKEVVKGLGGPGTRREVRDKRGALLGTAICDQGWLAARVVRHGQGPLDQAWLDSLLDRAHVLRQRVVDPDTTGFRLVNAENDGLPGVRIDWWDHYAVIALDSPTLASLLPGLCTWLEHHLSPRGIVLCYRKDHRGWREKPKEHPE